MRNKTVFIIGAGAGCEIDMPIGSELKIQISEDLSYKQNDWGEFQLGYGDDLIYAAINELVKEGKYTKNILYEAAAHISLEVINAKSIDVFIGSQDKAEVALLGKMAIVNSILKKERECPFFIDPKNIYNKMEHTSKKNLYSELFSLINQKRFDDLREVFSRLLFINFNYDRCLEQFLFHSIKQHYNKTEKEVIDVFEKINIYHPYGQVGIYNPTPFSLKNNTVAFGQKVGPDRIIEIAESISTFNEAKNEVTNHGLVKAKSDLSLAKQICFLGFGYHKQNLKLLELNLKAHSQVQYNYFGTAKGESMTRIDVAKRDIESAFGRPLTDKNQLFDLDCSSLIQSEGILFDI